MVSIRPQLTVATLLALLNSIPETERDTLVYTNGCTIPRRVWREGYLDRGDWIEEVWLGD